MKSLCSCSIFGILLQWVVNSAITDSISKVKAKLETYFDWHGGSIHADTAKISNKSVWISWIDICSLLVKIFARKIGLVRKKIWNVYLGAMSTWFTPKPALLPPVKPTEMHRKTTANQPMVQSTKATAIIKTPWPRKPEFEITGKNEMSHMKDPSEDPDR